MAAWTNGTWVTSVLLSITAGAANAPMAIAQVVGIGELVDLRDSPERSGIERDPYHGDSLAGGERAEAGRRRDGSALTPLGDQYHPPVRPGLPAVVAAH